MKSFKGMCFTCSKYGHICDDCPDIKQEVTKRRFNGSCRFCGIYCHMEQDYRKDEISQQEKAHLVQGESDCEPDALSDEKYEIIHELGFVLGDSKVDGPDQSIARICNNHVTP